MQLNPLIIRQQVESLKIAYPSLLEDDEAWQMSLESETDINGFLTNLVRQWDDAKGGIGGAKDRIEEWTARKDRCERRAEALRELAFKIMQAADLAKVVLPLATLSLRAGTQQLVGDADPNELPESLVKISRTLDRTAIKNALKDGLTVPGFSLSNSTPSLTIRIK